MGSLASGVGTVFILAYFAVVLGVGIYVLLLATRFVKAHQRGAEALETIAKKISPTANG